MTCRRLSLPDARRAARSLGLPRTVGIEVLLDGMRHEAREHRDVLGCSAVKAARVAATHLRERPDYYRALARVLRRT